MIKFDEDLQKVIPVALRRRGKKLVPEPTIVTTEIKHREGRIFTEANTSIRRFHEPYRERLLAI